MSQPENDSRPRGRRIKRQPPRGRLLVFPVERLVSEVIGTRPQIARKSFKKVLDNQSPSGSDLSGVKSAVAANHAKKTQSPAWSAHQDGAKKVLVNQSLRVCFLSATFYPIRQFLLLPSHTRIDLLSRASSFQVTATRLQLIWILSLVKM